MIAANSMLTSSAMYSSDHSLSFTVAEPNPTAAPQSESHSLFAQLRKHYPAGALLSELVQIHDGQFVVRALVQVGTATLATAMAAADQVEEAEDRARVRAMAVLGISPAIGRTPLMSPTFEVQAQPLMKESLKEQDIPDSLPFVESRVESTLPEFEETPEVVEPAKKSSRKKKEKEEVSAESDLLSFSGFDSFESLPELVEDDYSTESQSEPEYSEKPLQAEADADEPMKETLPDLSSEPIDLSDAIAQIGTEIERIGWTKKQGSTYLQQTYSKKTRAELTEDELLEFLHYLKALPSKGHPSLNQLPF